ncbi:hypothetical protein COLO4_17573 [Corchorus olitorius]|uniref:Uncharacterized protein n=1 Tax=Corchorus olitorius TaxID=93759 RepID=A0A1R3JCB4_9ROSI|nr:hypothetical protein COLO4_17573 [Corchorus olitorius]
MIMHPSQPHLKVMQQSKPNLMNMPFCILNLAVVSTFSIETLFPPEFPLTLAIIRYMLAFSMMVGLSAFLSILQGFHIWSTPSIGEGLLERCVGVVYFFCYVREEGGIGVVYIF